MHPYEDILCRPRPVSKKRVPMSMVDRGAQFSPFAALTGYEAVLEESARKTEAPTCLTEGSIAALNDILTELCSRLTEQPWAAYTCYVPDDRKAGGSYRRIEGRLKKYDCLEKTLILTDGREVPVETIVSIETE